MNSSSDVESFETVALTCIRFNFFCFNLYTVHFCSVFTINPKMHYSDSLLFHSTASTFRRTYVVSELSFMPAELH
jgi:hypothetical protein